MNQIDLAGREPSEGEALNGSILKMLWRAAASALWRREETAGTNAEEQTAGAGATHLGFFHDAGGWCGRAGFGDGGVGAVRCTVVVSQPSV